MNQLKDGERHGYWEQYHEDGSLSSKGNYIDGIYNSSPNGIILGLCLGLFVGFYNLAKAIWK